MITREQAEAIIQQQVVQAVMQDTPQDSTFMSLARRLPNMTSNQTRIKVLDLLPLAYWVSGDTGFKRTSEQAWDNVYLNAEELAVIVPIPEAVVNDAEFDILGAVTPRVVEAIHQCADSAAVFGVNRPAGWDADIITRARQAGNNVSVGDDTDLYDAILGDGGLFAKVEEGGYGVTGVLAGLSMRGKLRGLRDDVGQPLFTQSMQGGTSYMLDTAPIIFPKNGSWDNSVAQMIVGDWSQAVYAIRQDITTKILTEGVIQDPATKEIVYNLAQQDMIALRVVFRMGWALPNPVTRLDGDRVTCPFAYLEPATPATTQTVTFTVTDADSSPVAGAIVAVNGARLKTNASGVAVFNLRAGSYKATIKAAGYTTAYADVAVVSSAVTKTVTLAAIS